MRCEGIVRCFHDEEGYGRIMINGDEDHLIFVHFSSILPDDERFSEGFRFLRKGQKVAFDLIKKPYTHDQKLSAENVIVISD